MTRFRWILEGADLRAGRLKGAALDAADAGDSLEAAKLYNRMALEVLDGLNAAAPLFDSKDPEADLDFSLFMSGIAMVEALHRVAASHHLAAVPPAGHA